MKLTPVGIDLSKSVFQLSIADVRYRIVQRKRLSRAQFHRWIITSVPHRLVMEACGTSHYWSRVAQEAGHEVVLLHATYVRPYVRRNKTDSADADALLQAVQDTTLKAVPVKSEQHQALQSLHRIRERWKSSRVAGLNCARGLLAEFGVSLPKLAGEARLREASERVPALLQATVQALIDDCSALKLRIAQVDRELTRYSKTDIDCQRLTLIAGVGVTTATALVARVPSIHAFSRGRSFASWLGLTCRESSSGNTRRLGRISKNGDRYLRTLLIHGARSALLAAKRKANNQQPLTRIERWSINKEQSIGHNKATVALANKMARVIWATWSREENYNGNDALRFAA